MKIALLLGSFNPVHRAHVKIARFVVENKIAERVWCVVAKQNPLKNQTEVAFEHRAKMVDIAFLNDNKINVCDVEKNMQSPTYTIHTIAKLKTDFPENDFFILCGSDIVEQLEKWYKIDQLREMIEFKVYPRGGGECSDEFKNADIIEVSSSAIREVISKDNLPDGVYDYIIENGLYTESWSEVQYVDRGNLLYAKGEFGAALNAFNAALGVDPECEVARQMAVMIKEILAFRYTDIYNP